MVARAPIPIAIVAFGLALASMSEPACSSSPESEAPAAPRPLAPGELALRLTLGVPKGAKTVIVFAQNAHLDIDWQKTFDGYYAAFVGDVLLEARQILETQPRAFYSVAEMAFLEHHLVKHPEELAPLKAAAKRGAFRIVGGGVTSPDTLLPETEMLLRDYLLGIRYAEDTFGLTPRAAWLPDSFGHSASAPDVLAAAGFESVAFARVDGAPTLFEQTLHPNRPPLPDSTAAKLRELGTADFRWKGAGGATVLAHWMAAPGLYCAGDNIDYNEHLEPAGGHIGTFEGDNPEFTDGQIDGYADAMRPYAKTPYVFVPVGCDFAHPKPRLLEYLDGYNARRYPATGAWAVAASFEDYAKLVGFWSDVLPELSLDMTPYYQGFYGSRAGVKRGARDAARPFFVAETFASALGAAGQALTQAASPALTKLVRTNHHDFVTGTSADDVVASEQMPLLVEAEAAGATLLGKVASAIAIRIPAGQGAVLRLLALNASGIERSDVAEVSIPIAKGVAPVLHAMANGNAVPLELVAPPGPSDTTGTVRLALGAMPPFSWRSVELYPGAALPAPAVKLELLDGNGAPAKGAAVVKVVLSNPRVRAEWQKKAGFVLTSLAIDGTEVIAHDSFVIHDYKDTGGLWRTGNEMQGCELSPLPLAAADATVTVLESSSLLARVAFGSGATVREASLGAAATGLSLALTTGAAEGTTRTVALSLAVPTDAKLGTSLPAGAAERPLEHLYSPTFWPAVAWARVGAVAVLLRQSTGARMSVPGELELMTARDARAEQCDLEGGVGSDPDSHRFEWRIERAATAALAEQAAQAFNRPLMLELVPTVPGAKADLLAEQSLLLVTGDGIVSALKPADRGEGVIVRALLLPGPVTVKVSPLLGSGPRTLVDVAERDVRALDGSGPTLVLDPKESGILESVRLR